MIPTTFVDAWVPEFIKSVEMFTGAGPTRETAPPSDATFAVDEPWFWLHHDFTRRDGTGRLWICVPLARGLALVAAGADDEAGREALLREVVSQSLQAAAQVLDTGDCPGLRCSAEGASEEPPASAPTGSVFWFRADDTLVPLTLRAEASFAGLCADEDASVDPQAPESDLTEPSGVPAAFARFEGVELPVRVVLGRAALRVRNVLELTVGSLIELDTRQTDSVDVCVHDAVIARGEVVSIRGNYGVRVKDVISERDRLGLSQRGRCRTMPASKPSRVH